MVEFGTYYPQYNVSFTAGDLFRVSVESGVVKYKKNGVVYHTSSGIVTYPLKVDTALYTSNSTLTNVVVGGNWSGGSGGGGGSSSSEVLWLVADHLGTPRMILDETGWLANIKRHDYLPFGEELFAGTGGRTQQQGYTASDNVRQKFTSKERDIETGLDYFGARYYASIQGRFTSPDPLSFWMLERKKQDIYIANPQRWNKYAYVLNNPLRYIDPDGLAEIPAWNDLDKKVRDDLAKRLGKDAQKIWNGWSNDQRQHVLNVRAVLIDKGVWKEVTSITYGRVDVKNEWGARNTVNFTPDNSQSSWSLGILSSKNMEHALKEAGFQGESANWNHEEGRYTMKQPGDDVILHMVLLDKPADAYSVPHFDAGGGSIFSRQHFKEWLTGKGMSHDQITTGIGKTSAGQHLRGISESMDKLLVQPKPR